MVTAASRVQRMRSTHQTRPVRINSPTTSQTIICLSRQTVSNSRLMRGIHLDSGRSMVLQASHRARRLISTRYAAALRSCFTTAARNILGQPIPERPGLPGLGKGSIRQEQWKGGRQQPMTGMRDYHICLARAPIHLLIMLEAFTTKHLQIARAGASNRIPGIRQ